MALLEATVWFAYKIMLAHKIGEKIYNRIGTIFSSVSLQILGSPLNFGHTSNHDMSPNYILRRKVIHMELLAL